MPLGRFWSSRGTLLGCFCFICYDSGTFLGPLWGLSGIYKYYFVLLVMLQVILGSACARTPSHFDGLDEVILGTAVTHRGGRRSYAIAGRRHKPVHYYDTMTLEEQQIRMQSNARLKNQTGASSRAFKDDTILWSWNCQKADTGMIRQWSAELQGSIVVLPGTQRRYDVAIGERTCTRWKTDHHDVIEARVQMDSKRGCQPEGAAILLPTGYGKFIKTIYVPTAKDLEGHGLAIGLPRGLHDICYVSVYCPLGGAGCRPQPRAR